MKPFLINLYRDGGVE